MNQTLRRTLTCAAALLLAVDVLCLFAPAKFGTCCLVIPDALENVLCAENFIQEGRYGFYLNGGFFPSRYLPWLPVVLFAPFQFLANDPYAAVYGAWTAAAALAVLMFFAAKQTAQRPGEAGKRDVPDAVFAGLLTFPVLLLSPFFIALTGYAMTEIPYLALCVGAMMVWVRMVRADSADKTNLDIRLLMWYAVLTALAGAVRSTAYPMLLLPVLLILRREKAMRRQLKLLAAVVLPSCAAVGLSAVFNLIVFGSMSRSGYHYWCPVSYDDLFVTFHPRYIAEHFPLLIRESGAALTCILLAVCGLRRFLVRRRGGGKNTGWDAAMEYALLQSGVIFCLYIVYFYYHGRMFLPIPVILLPPAAAAFVDLVRVMFRGGHAARWISGGLVLVIQIAALHNLNTYHKAMREIPGDRANLELLSSMLPRNAVLLSPFNPALADRFLLRGTDRKIIPIDRSHEYVNKIAAPQKVRNITPPPRSPEDNLAPGLLAQPGCFLPFPYALSDDPGRLKYLLESGTQIYFITGSNRRVPEAVHAVLQFAEPVAAGRKGGLVLWRLQLKSEK